MTGAAPAEAGQYAARRLTRAGLSAWLPKLCAMSVGERAQIPGVSAGRARQLLAGALVADASMDLFGLDELAICPWALREGIILRRLDTLDSPTDRRRAALTG